MNKGNRRTTTAAGRVSPDAARLGIVIGARHVTMTQARVDQPSHLIRMHEWTASFPIPRDHTLGLAQIRAGLVQCLSNVEGLDDRRCAVMLPSEVCDVRQASGSIPIPPVWGAPADSPAPVTETHIRQITRAVCDTARSPVHAVTGVAHERFVLGGRFNVAAPVGSVTHRLDARMHLFLADYGFARGILDLLGDLDFAADVLATPLSTLIAQLPPGESESDCILVEVSQRHSGLGLFCRGVPIRLAEVDRGADDVIAAAAGRLGVDERTVRWCLTAKRELLLDPAAYANIALPVWTATGTRAFTVGDVDAAVAAEALPLAARIQGCIEETARDSGFHSRRVILLGDCPVLMRALAAAGNRSASGYWFAREEPDWYRDPVEPMATDRTRMAGLLKQCVLSPLPAQPFLSDYYRIPVNPEIREAFGFVQGAGRRMAGFWNATRPRVWRACERFLGTLHRRASHAASSRRSRAADPASPSPGPD